MCSAHELDKHCFLGTLTRPLAARFPRPSSPHPARRTPLVRTPGGAFSVPPYITPSSGLGGYTLGEKFGYTPSPLGPRLAAPARPRLRGTALVRARDFELRMGLLA